MAVAGGSVGWKIPENVDLIESLNRRFLPHIIEKIFCALDLESLTNAVAASSTWNEIILDCNIWPKMHKKLELKTDEEDLQWRRTSRVVQGSTIWLSTVEAKTFPTASILFHELCKKINALLQILPNNWKHGHAKIGVCSDIVRLWSNIRTLQRQIELTDMCVVKSCADGSIEVWDRWAMQLCHVLTPVFEGGHGIHNVDNTIKAIQLNDDIIVAGYCHGQICVWSMESKNLINVFLDNDAVDDAYSSLNSFEHLCLSQDGGYLVSCSSVSTGMLVTVRKIGSPTLMIVSARKVLMGPCSSSHRDVTDVIIDGFRVVIGCVKQRHAGGSLLEVQVRNIEDLSLSQRIKQKFRKDSDAFEHRMDCRAGVLVVAMSNSLRFWNIESGISLNAFKLIGNCARSILSIRLITDNHFVTAHCDGTLRVWDLNSALVKDTSVDKMIVHSFAHPNFHPRGSPKVLLRGDEFQVICEVVKLVHTDWHMPASCKRSTIMLDFLTGAIEEITKQ